MSDFRRRTAKPGQLMAYYGKIPHDSPDVVYAWGGAGATKSDGNFLAHILGSKRLRRAITHLDLEASGGSPFLYEKSFLEELEARGYDITTLRFSIQQKAAPPAPPTDVPAP